MMPASAANELCGTAPCPVGCGAVLHPADLRRDLQRVIRDGASTDVEFERILDALVALRGRELDLWRSELDALVEFMTARQRVEFLHYRERFNQQVLRARTQARR